MFFKYLNWASGLHLQVGSLFSGQMKTENFLVTAAALVRIKVKQVTFAVL